MTNCQDVFLSKSHSYEEINIEHKNSYIYITLNPYFILLSQVWFNIVRRLTDKLFLNGFKPSSYYCIVGFLIGSVGNLCKKA